ncbi:hypothetical protein ILUMI_17011 [Ignelater luminosus]|uniref:Uncharacterized protein n=1 Tax=Ignelater luminosus TaxID=2038154 RepID=A0A8K0CRU2_IGNLU|nr:hypothetical protein ILUMI_17011 [Ignelater luminosus]
MDDKSSLAHSDNNADTSLSSCDSNISPEQKTKPFTQLEFRSEITQILLLDEEPLDDDGDVPIDGSEDGSDHLCNLPNTNIGKHFTIPIPDGPNICRRCAVCKNKTRYIKKIAAKKRTFFEDCIKFGFNFIEKDVIQLPQCVICLKVLSDDSMRLIRLERHLSQQHPTMITKSKEFSSSKSETLKRIRLDKSGSYHKVESQHLKASFEIALVIAQQKKPHTTNDAPVVIGARSGLAQELKEKNPTLVSTHCVIHRQALASKTLPQNLRQTLDSAINVVNYIKSSILNSRLFTLLCAYLDSDHRVLLFHAVIRWLCKGNMLARLYELKDELKIKIEAHLQALKHELDRYYRDSISELSLWHITRNPFVVDVLQLPEVVLEESL